MLRRRGPARPLLPSVLLLLLLVGPGSAAASDRVELAVRADRLSSPSAAFAGPFGGAALLEAVLADGGLAVDAVHAEVELDRSERPAVVDLAGWGISALPTDESSSRSSHGAVAWTAAATDGQARVLLWPLEGGGAVASGEGPVDVLPSDERLRAFTAVSASRSDHEVPLAGLTVTGSGLELRGDFRIAVSGLLLKDAADGGAGDLDTRRRDEPAPGMPASTPVRRTLAFEAVAELHGAVVRLPPAAAISLGRLEVTARELTLEGTHGALAGTVAEGQQVELHGRLQAVLEPHDGAADMLAAVGGRLSSATIGTTAVAVSDAGRSPDWAWLGGTGLLLGLAAAHAAAGRLRFRRLDRAVRGRRYDDALDLAGRFRLHPWFAQDAALAAALSLTELGRAAEARERLLAGRWAARRQPTRDFLLARAAAIAGDRTETVRRLAASLLADPGLMAQARTDPALAPLVTQMTGALEAYA